MSSYNYFCTKCHSSFDSEEDKDFVICKCDYLAPRIISKQEFRSLQAKVERPEKESAAFEADLTVAEKEAEKLQELYEGTRKNFEQILDEVDGLRKENKRIVETSAELIASTHKSNVKLFTENERFKKALGMTVEEQLKAIVPGGCTFTTECIVEQVIDRQNRIATGKGE